MGIPALWDVIQEQDRNVPIAHLAEEHYKEHGRPLTIAIDEADWRFNNLTSQQVYIIREKSNEPAFQGIEKSIFFRICRWMTLNIRLLFVFDGPRRPWKRGRAGQGRIDYEKLRLLKELLRHFQIPYHEAPGEAEAECARLQRLGIVDAVFSQDSDSLMFGCDFLIRDDRVAKEKGNNDRSKENTRKSGTSVRVIRGHDIQRAHHMDREGLVLFAMLCGGDYDMKGLERCGAAIAIHAVRAGLGQSLCRSRTKADCLQWREELVDWLQTQKRFHGFVPYDYPDIKTLNKYNCPTVSSDEQLLNLRGIRGGWDRAIDELKLLELTSSRFNIWGDKYMNWVGPVLLTKYLVSRDSSLPRENVHQITFIERRKKKNEDESTTPIAERKFKFSPFGLTSLQSKDFEGERAGYWTGTSGAPLNPHHLVEKELPEYLLRKVLPSEMFNPPLAVDKAGRKRKRLENTDTHINNVETPSITTTKERGRSTNVATPHLDLASTQTQRRQSASHGRVPPRANCISLLSDSEEENHPPKKSARANIRSRSWIPAGLEVEEEEEQLDRAFQMNLPQISCRATILLQ